MPWCSSSSSAGGAPASLLRWSERLLGAKASRGLAGAALAIVDVEDSLVVFYSTEPVRLVLSVGATFLEWMLRAIAVWVTLDVLGHPVVFSDAIVIEALTLLVVSTFFFVPGDLGTQESTIVLVCTAFTGSSSIGLALAAVRRIQGIVWTACGLAIGSTYSVRRVDPTTESGATP